MTNTHRTEKRIRSLIHTIENDLDQLRSTDDPEETMRIRKRISIKNRMIDTLMDGLEAEIFGQTEHGDQRSEDQDGWHCDGEWAAAEPGEGVRQ